MHQESNEQKCYPLHMDHVPEYFYQKALKELNETPETTAVELNKLKDLLSADKLTTGVEFEEDFLHQFLRHCKYNSLKAFQNLLKYVNFRRSNSSIFRSIPDEHFEGNPSTKFVSVLPYRCPEGCVIVLYHLGNWNPSEFPIEYVKIEAIASFLQPLRYPVTQISGFKIIFDFKDTLKLMRFCTPQNLLLFYNASFNCLPARYKEIHVINKNIAMTAAYALVKHFLSEKMRERIFFHSNPEDILNYFHSSLLPVEYGGNLKNYHDVEIMKKMNTEHGKFPEGGQPNYL